MGETGALEIEFEIENFRKKNQPPDFDTGSPQIEEFC
jgi:hypothetical protein